MKGPVRTLTDDQLDALEWRRRYLGYRIEAKIKAGGDATYDHRERDALDAALKLIAMLPAKKPAYTPPVLETHTGVFSDEVRQATRDRLAQLEVDGRSGNGRITFPHLTHGKGSHPDD